MNRPPKILFFFTSDYPIGSGEPFIENEIKYLSNAFSKVVIISNNISSNQKRTIPKNCFTEKISYQINSKYCWLSAFRMTFWKELFIILFHYKIKLTRSILNTMVVSLCKISSFKKPIYEIINHHSSNTDIKILYSYWANDIALAVSHYGKKNHIKSFTRAHGWDVYFEINKVKYLPYRSLLFANLDKVFFISNDGINYYKKKLPKYSLKYSLSRLGVCENSIINTGNRNILSLVSCSNIVPLKRIDLIIEALSILETIPIKWIHIGDGVLINKLKSLSKEKLLFKRNIKFEFCGQKSNQEVIKFYKNNIVNLFINVSQSEGIPVSIMEAMSFGIPVLATNVGGTPEIVKNGINGFLLSQDPTPKEIAETILKFHNLSEDEKLTLQKNAYNTWKNKFNAEKNYQEFVDIILSL